MDLRLLLSVVARRWYVVLVGLAVAIALATLSYFRVSFVDGAPELEPRKEQIWQSQADVLLTERGFPAGRRTIPLEQREVGGEVTFIPKYNDPFRYSGLATLYSRIAESDEVRSRVGRIDGSYDAIGGADTTYGRATQLPMVSFFGRSTSPETAQAIAARAMTAFVTYMQERQREARIPANERVLFQVLNAPQPPILLEPRKKTLPIVVFLSILIATIALAFVLDNARRRMPPESDLAESDERAVSRIRRWSA